MRLSAREDIDAPIDQVFAVLSDFDQVEAAARKRGISVERSSNVTPPAPGMTWGAQFAFRGKPREATVSLTEIQRPNLLVFDSASGGLETQVRMELVEVSASKTRVMIKADMSPKTLAARLLVQSLKLAKANVEKRFKSRFGDVARLVEDRARDVV